MLGDEVVERGHHAVARAALADRRCRSVGFMPPRAHQLRAPGHHAPAVVRLAELLGDLLRARSRGRVGRRASSTSCRISSGSGATARGATPRAAAGARCRPCTSCGRRRRARRRRRPRPGSTLRLRSRWNTYRPGNRRSCSAGSNAGTGSIDVQLGVGPERCRACSTVVSPRSAPISTMRCAPDAAMSGAMTVSQNGNISTPCRRRDQRRVRRTRILAGPTGAAQIASVAARVSGLSARRRRVRTRGGRSPRRRFAS